MTEAYSEQAVRDALHELNQTLTSTGITNTEALAAVAALTGSILSNLAPTQELCIDGACAVHADVCEFIRKNYSKISEIVKSGEQSKRIH